ncbi:response regulator transcription factor [Nocardioides sp. Soil805]|uniref:response regulator transcription factor n=1 Tax=Nocardioides sp. Soil805 TaxID=1736416 RepID=UPI0009EB07BD|nr:response regulator transcription factor [Nocardioides sp. Soil805]
MVLKVALVDADELVVRGVAAMLQAQGDGCQLVDLGSSSADIVLCDTVATSRGQRRVARLLEDARVGKVVVYTWNFQPWLAGELIRQGASGYLSKGLPAAELVSALRAVQGGRVVVAPDRRGLTGGNAWVGQAEGLTAREAEVLSLIVGGLSNNDVADQMGLSINSVKSYVRSCYRKIDADSRSQAVLWGLTHGLGPGSHDVRAEPEAAQRRERPA